MKTATVICALDMKKAAPGWEGARLLLVQAGLEELAAVDLTGAQPGERVLLVTGAPGARQSPQFPADAAVVGVLS